MPESGVLLERSEQMEVLAGAARAAGRGKGSVVLVSGEAGAGKSALVRAFQSLAPRGSRVLTGYCEALSTPRSLGPFKDIADGMGAEFRAAVRAGDRDRVMSALVPALASGPTTMLVVEDVHWADEGTLDVLRHAARRIDTVPALLVLTFRDDEVAPTGLSSLVSTSASTIVTLGLPALTVGAVRALCEGHEVDADEVFHLTTGNPYLVTELLNHAPGPTPASVVGAVAERLDRLPRDTRGRVEQLAVVPGIVEPRLAATLVEEDWGSLVPAETQGLITVTGGHVAFRHELTRLGVLETVPGAHQLQLHRRVLDVLIARGDADPGRLVHHAVACGDVATVLAEGPRAAREAAASGSHREAAAHYRRVLEHEAWIPSEGRADLWEQLAIELYRSGDTDAVGPAERAVSLRRSDQDRGALVRGLCWLSRLAWVAATPTVALAAADEAVSLAATESDAGARALALANRSQLAMLRGQYGTAIELGRQAAEFAAEVGDTRTSANALNNVGASLMSIGYGGVPELRRSIELALSVPDVEAACRGLGNLAWGLLARYEVAAADAAALEGLDVAVGAEHRVYELHLVAIRSRIALANCEWERALDLAAQVPTSAPNSHGVALVVQALVAARTASHSPFARVREAWRAAEQADELQRRGPVAAASLEASHLTGAWFPLDLATAVYDEAARLGDHRLHAELAYRLGVVGHPRSEPELGRLEGRTDSPYLLQAQGRAEEAAERWRALGRRFEEAQALAESDDPRRRLEALELLDDLGAVGVAQRVRRDLREAGVTSVPRGPTTSTRLNPSGLTDRQLDVLALIAEGLTNAEIADRLVLSRRTVDTHVSAVLAKLDVPTRRRAGEVYRDLIASDVGSPVD